jgi:hypothetical protein
MILEDFVMLGKTAPETDRQGRVTVCSAGWSPELRQLVRIYPLAEHNCPPDFSVSQVRLERNTKDSRGESWKIAGDRDVSVHPYINSRFDVRGILNDRESLIEQLPMVESIMEANQRRLSLAVVQPDNAPKFYLEVNKKRVIGKKSTKSYDYIPRLRFSVGGKTHKLKYLNQKVYDKLGINMYTTGLLSLMQGFEKNPKLLIGNMFAFRNNWLVISGLGAHD